MLSSLSGLRHRLYIIDDDADSEERVIAHYACSIISQFCSRFIYFYLIHVEKLYYTTNVVLCATLHIGLSPSSSFSSPPPPFICAANISPPLLRVTPCLRLHFLGRAVMPTRMRAAVTAFTVVAFITTTTHFHIHDLDDYIINFIEIERWMEIDDYIT